MLKTKLYFREFINGEIMGIPVVRSYLA